mmetsp:Transcript_9323/g.26656  ORF Transcript_9323/g.26656 Transcript_9323/m.26656 type:complete len:200 (-) Transcript_9323:123-722(-)
MALIRCSDSNAYAVAEDGEMKGPINSLTVNQVVRDLPNHTLVVKMKAAKSVSQMIEELRVNFQQQISQQNDKISQQSQRLSKLELERIQDLAAQIIQRINSYASRKGKSSTTNFGHQSVVFKFSKALGCEDSFFVKTEAEIIVDSRNNHEHLRLEDLKKEVAHYRSIISEEHSETEPLACMILKKYDSLVSAFKDSFQV